MTNKKATIDAAAHLAILHQRKMARYREYLQRLNQLRTPRKADALPTIAPKQSAESEVEDHD